MRQKATVKFFNVDKGYGFLVPADGSGDVFFGISSVVGGTKVTKGDSVLFVPGQDRKARPRASSVELVDV
jgi:cold shock protein